MQAVTGGRVKIGAGMIAALFTAVAPPATAEIIRIEAKGVAFAPAEVSAHLGDTIEWSNSDFVAHTATARNHDWDVVLPPHSSRRIILEKPGLVDYYCRYHPTMKGKITGEKHD